jgi:MFS transporter, ACS family, D-galactonate transporter
VRVLSSRALQPVSQALAADVAEPSRHGSMFGMMNPIGEIGAVLSPAVSGVLRDATGSRGGRGMARTRA